MAESSEVWQKHKEYYPKPVVLTNHGAERESLTMQIRVTFLYSSPIPYFRFCSMHHPRQNALKEKTTIKSWFHFNWFPVKIFGGFTSTISIPVPKIGSTHPWSNQVQSWPLVVPLSLLLPDFSSIPIAWYIPAILQVFSTGKMFQHRECFWFDKFRNNKKPLQ